MGSQDGFPTVKDCQYTLVAFLFSPAEDPLMTQIEVPLDPVEDVPYNPGFPRGGPLGPHLPPGEGPPAPPGSLSGALPGQPGPPGGGSLGPSCDSRSQDPPG